MTTININFGDVEQSDRTTIKAGKYEVVVNGIEVRQSDNSEHPYLNWELEITEGEHEGRKLYMITSLSPKALWNLQNVFQSYGLDEDEVELDVDEDTNMLLSPDLTGEAGVAQVVNKLYEGRPQAKVTSLVGGSSAPAKKNGAKTTAKSKVKSKAKVEEDDEEEEAVDVEEEEEEKPKATRKVSPFTKGKAGANKRRFK